ncbi:MAG: cyclic nucleotide-binding/CBS domain-containing protein [Candidatus Methylomirabilales bacterium]
MEPDETAYDEDLRYEEDTGPAKTLDTRLFQEPIRGLRRRVERVSAVPLGASIGEAARLMRETGTGCVLVERGGTLVGILTERDILNKLVGTGYDPATTPVDGVMTPNPETLRPEDPIAFALQRMSVGGYRHIPLVDAQGRAVGVLSVKDVVDFLVEQFPREVLNIPPEPGVQPRAQEGA